MNRTLPLALLIICLSFTVFGQAPKPDRQPITLSPEASRQWKELNLQIVNLQLRQQLIAAHANVPEDYLVAGFDQQTGQVVYIAPQAAPKLEAPKAQPSPKP